MESEEQRKARWDREAQTRALKQQAEAAERQTELMERQLREQKKQAKQSKNRESGKGNFHGLYCLLIGWWLAMFLVCCIVPLFFSGGRKLIKKAFGIW